MAEMAKPRDTFVLARGDYRNHGEKVTPGVPALFPPLPKDAPANRLSMAEWLFSPQHPLTARVAVNRYWQLYFGIGLVKTTEDFGSQGDAPVQRDASRLAGHRVSPELGREGSAKADRDFGDLSPGVAKSAPELLEKDPENRLLARGPRFRLPAEMVRDNALAASRLLTQRHRRTQRVSLSAAGTVGRACRAAKRSPRRNITKARARICTGAACTRSGSALCLPPR